jgi:methylglutaconyl-CoA hydratase
MSRTLSLYALAHGRSGDKGDAVNIGIIARRAEWLPLLRDILSEERVLAFLGTMAKGPVERFEMPNLHALNFLVHGALGGGGSVALQLDAQGKTYSHALLRFPVEVSDALYAQVVEHWEGELPAEAFQAAPFDEEGYEDLVSVRDEGRIAVVELRRGARHNALSLGLIQKLREVVRRVSATPRVKVVVLTGEGRSFCAGLDLRELSMNFSRDHIRRLARELAGLLEDLLTVPQPLIGAIHGGALGGGTALALTCDVLFAHGATTRLGFPEVRIGFVPGLVSVLAMRRIPPATAREMMLSGRAVDATEALAAGWVHRVVQGEAPEATLGAAIAYATEMVEKNNDDAMRRSKAMVAALERPNLDHELRQAIDSFVAEAEGEWFRRGMDAFTRKEALDWSLL